MVHSSIPSSHNSCISGVVFFVRTGQHTQGHLARPASQPSIEAIWPSLRVSQLAISKGQRGLGASQPGLKASQSGLRVCQPGLRVSQPGLTASQPTSQNFSPFYRSSSPPSSLPKNKTMKLCSLSHSMTQQHPLIILSDCGTFSIFSHGNHFMNKDGYTTISREL